MHLVKMKTLGFLLIIAVTVNCKINKPIDPDLLEYKTRLDAIQHKINTDEKWRKEWQRQVETFGHESLDPIPFDCDTSIGSTTANNVHELSVRAVNVVAAFGDSITAGHGLGAENLLEVAIQNRGESWCIGGEGNLEGTDLTHPYITLPNVLKKFNPNLKGFSIDDGWWFEDDSGLNIAVGGARARNMPQQAVNIIEKMIDTPGIDMENDWKLVTLFIGGNDLCAWCRSSASTPENYKASIEEALDILHGNLSRTLVNLVPMFDVTPLTEMSTGWLCDILQINFCICAVNETFKAQARTVQLDYFELLKDLVFSGKYDTRDDFTVVYQTMWRDQTPPLDPETGRPDNSFFSPDCFHPGRKSHQGFAYSIYNTMLLPVPQKPLVYPVEDNPRFFCPTEENPYIYTIQNSQPGYRASHSKSNMAHVNDASIQNTMGGVIGGIIGGVAGTIVLVALALGIGAAWKKKRSVSPEDQKTLEMEVPATA